jgi:VCBS repeat-containing protein
VYVRSGSIWSQQAELTAADGAQGDDFGASLAISGNTVLVGADGRTVNGHPGQGAVYQFVRSGTSWSQTAELAAADGATGDDLAYTIALSGDTAMAGAFSHTVAGNTSQGSAYFLELAAATATATVDVGLPTSAVSPLPRFSPTNFTVSWSGSDAGGPGVTSYSIFVSDNGGPFTALVSNTTATSAPFTGQVGHTYGFYSVATDSLGGTQSTPGRAQATTTAAAPVPPPTANLDTFVLGSNGAANSGSGPTSVLANDTSADGQPQNFIATLMSTTAHGNLTLNSDGAFTYTAGPAFKGIDRFTYQLSEGITTGNTATVTLLSYNASLVDKLYHQVLHRSAEDGGLLYWTGQLDQGLPLDVVATGIFNSTERLDPLVTQFYQQYLNRGTDPGGLAYWVNDWQTKGDPRDVVENILASQEFSDDAGDTNAGFVTLLYQRVLQRSPEPTGLNYWVGLMSNPPTNPPETRFDIASQFYDTHEKHVDLVNFLFSEYFSGVSPLPSTQPYVADLDFPLSQTETQVEKAIIDSPDYRSNPPAPAVSTVGKPLYPH